MRKPRAPKVAKKAGKVGKATAAETKSAAGAFEKGSAVTYAGGGKAGLKAGQALTFLRATLSHGRYYATCRVGETDRRVTVAPGQIKRAVKP